MISNPKSPAPGGVSLDASSAATRLTSDSSEPSTAYIFALAALVFAFGIAISSHADERITRSCCSGRGFEEYRGRVSVWQGDKCRLVKPRVIPSLRRRR